MWILIIYICFALKSNKLTADKHTVIVKNGSNTKYSNFIYQIEGSFVTKRFNVTLIMTNSNVIYFRVTLILWNKCLASRLFIDYYANQCENTKPFVPCDKKLVDKEVLNYNKSVSKSMEFYNISVDYEYTILIRSCDIKKKTELCNLTVTLKSLTTTSVIDLFANSSFPEKRAYIHFIRPYNHLGLKGYFISLMPTLKRCDLKITLSKDRLNFPNIYPELRNYRNSCLDSREYTLDLNNEIISFIENSDAIRPNQEYSVSVYGINNYGVSRPAIIYFITGDYFSSRISMILINSQMDITWRSPEPSNGNIYGYFIMIYRLTYTEYMSNVTMTPTPNKCLLMRNRIFNFVSRVKIRCPSITNITMDQGLEEMKLSSNITKLDRLGQYSVCIYPRNSYGISNATCILYPNHGEYMSTTFYYVLHSGLIISVVVTLMLMLVLLVFEWKAQKKANEAERVQDETALLQEKELTKVDSQDNDYFADFSYGGSPSESNIYFNLSRSESLFLPSHLTELPLLQTHDKKSLSKLQHIKKESLFMRPSAIRPMYKDDRLLK